MTTLTAYPPSLRNFYQTLTMAWGIMSYGRKASNRVRLLAGLWNVLDPVVTVLAYWFLLAQIFGFREEAYIVFLFLSITLHRFAMSALTRGTSAFLRFKVLIMGGVLPSKRVVVYASLLENLFDFLIAFGVFLILALLTGHRPTWAWMSLVPLGALFGGFALAAMYFLSCLGVYWRDLTASMTLVVRLLLFLCPVLYPISRIPESALPYYMLNPLACFYHMFRRVLLDGQWPEPGYLLYVAGFVAALYPLGLFTFRRLEGRAAKYW